MGLSLEFYAGDPDEIGRAFTEIEFDGLRDGTLAHNYADLSLHISPTDLDILSKVVADVTHNEPVLLLESLCRSVGGTAGESDASLVSDDWVAIIAAAPKELAAQITRLWLEAASKESGEPYVVDSPDAVIAVEGLITLCREAVARGTSVVFAWYL